MANKYTAYTYVTDTEAECNICKQKLPHSSFYIDKKNKYRQSLSYSCKECTKIRSRAYHKNRIETDSAYRLAKKSAYLKSEYGLTLSEYMEKLHAQKYCAICGVELSANDPNSHLDHCHRTGKIRSFLCGNCNRGIGSFKDNIYILEKAIQYLKSHNEHENS